MANGNHWVRPREKLFKGSLSSEKGCPFTLPLPSPSFGLECFSRMVDWLIVYCNSLQVCLPKSPRLEKLKMTFPRFPCNYGSGHGKCSAHLRRA